MHIDLTSVVQQSPVKMKFYLLLSLVVGCWGIQWKAVNDFKDIFKDYSLAAVNTISSVENILDNSREESELFLTNAYSNNPVISRITSMKTTGDTCFARFIDEENLKFAFQIQIYQLQNPLRGRIVDIRERLSNINSSIGIYQGLAENKFWGCKAQKGSCLEETNQWLESTINSLSCAMYPNCSHHSIRKRSLCSPGEFRCNNGRCISGKYFCDGQYNCNRHYNDYSDEPSGCVRNCNGFRCSETFRCISHSDRCNGVDNCGDGSDEEGCPPPTTPTPYYSHVNCSKDAGDFLCDNNKCIGLERVCNGENDCGDWTDEGAHCDGRQCSPECARKGGVCFTGPKGSQCMYECPPGTYETSEGCKLNPEAPLATLAQVLDDTPRLTTRYATRLKFLKTKTIMALSKSLAEIVKCKKDEFSLLSKTINFSTIIHEEKDPSAVGLAVPESVVNVAVTEGRSSTAEYHDTSQVGEGLGRKGPEDDPGTDVTAIGTETSKTEQGYTNQVSDTDYI